VDGNLEITWIQNNTYDLSFLQHIREVTGYVLISHVDVEHVRLPRLQIIRGRTLFKLNVWKNEFGLFVSFSQMQTLELPALRDILNGSVGMFNNYNLCHVRTIQWDEILSGNFNNFCFIHKNLCFNIIVIIKLLYLIKKIKQPLMQRTYTLTTLLHLKEIVQHVTLVVKRDVGAKVQKIAKNLVKLIVLHNAHKEDVLVQSPEIVVIYFVPEVAQDQHKKTV
jgi:hypothetical protein